MLNLLRIIGYHSFRPIFESSKFAMLNNTPIPNSCAQTIQRVFEHAHLTRANPSKVFKDLEQSISS